MNEIVTEALGQIIIRNSNPKPWPFELLQVCNIFRFFIQNSSPKPTNAWLFPSPLAAIWNSSYSRCCRTIFGVKNIRWYGLRRKLPDWQNFLRHYTTKRRVRMFSSVNATGYIEKKISANSILKAPCQQKKYREQGTIWPSIRPRLISFSPKRYYSGLNMMISKLRLSYRSNFEC